MSQSAIITHLWSRVLLLLEQDSEESHNRLATALEESIASVVASGIVPYGFTPRAFVRILLAMQLGIRSVQAHIREHPGG